MKSAKLTNPPAGAVRFPVVGIGASAGGLEAFTKLLGNLPSDTGMAFVLIQHLSPSHESFLPEILARATSMPVVEVKDLTRVRANHVYVIPPNVTMGVRGGFLRLIPRGRDERPHLAIDFFFRSLAEDLQTDAIGVVLSGTGSDGAEGLKAIKGEGGISFAQSPNSAKFGDMPQRAISEDHVDFILAPEQIARELERISKHPFIKQSAPEDDADLPPHERDETDKILQLVKKYSGVDFIQYKRTTVQRRIRRRMVVHKVDRLLDYLTILKANRSEQIALFDDILINVTSFFRNPEVFEKLAATVFPELIKGRKAGDAIRVWVPGCATGEEAYSIAIALLEYLGDRLNEYPIQIFASDLSESCIAKARAGLYLEGIAENVSAERLARYFVKSDKGFRVNKLVRDFCVFAKQDVLNDPPFSRLDLISFRNVLIYLEPVLQRKALAVLSYALKPSGFLVLGNSESPSVAAAFFTVEEKKEKIYSLNPGSTRARPAFARSNQAQDAFPHRPAALAPSIVSDAADRETDRLIASHYAPPSVVINESLEIVQFRGDTSLYLTNPTGRSSFSILKMARDGLGPALRTLIDAVKKGAIAKSASVSCRQGGKLRSISVEVVPLRSASAHRNFLILFTADSAVSASRSAPTSEAGRPNKASLQEANRVIALTEELAESKAYLESLNRDLESSNQDLQSANEEVLSANEELQSTNEELETAKEELQSGNEELTTVNDELHTRNSELDRLNNDLTNLLASIEIPILMIDKNGRIRRVTPAAERALSLQASDVGRPMREMKSNFEVLNLDLDLEQKVYEVVDTMAVTETEIQDRKGRWFRLQMRPYRTLDNRIDGAVIALVDIDALKCGLTEVSRARAEAEKARASAEAGNRAKDVFLATLSHELRTPLTTILSFSQLLRMGSLPPDETKKAVLMIEQSALAQAQLINDLLDVSRIIMGKLALDVQNVDLAAILHAAVESVRPSAEKRSVRLIENKLAEAMAVRADPIRLRQVFLNLLTNAIKFSKPDSTIDVEVVRVDSPIGGVVQVRVRDSGKGIAEKFLPHIFDQFSQADSSSTRSHGGMGLGLAIVRSLTEAQGGSVLAESPGEGKGSTFTVSYPFIEENATDHGLGGLSLYSPAIQSPETGEGKEKGPLRLTNLKILLVDDDPSARDSIGAVLTSLGATVSAVNSAQAALDVLAEFRPDVLISDLAMPGEDGYGLLKRVRQRSPAQMGRVPALALTAFAGQDDVQRVLQAGFQAHLAKPVDANKLAATIIQVVKQGCEK